MRRASPLTTLHQSLAPVSIFRKRSDRTHAHAQSRDGGMGVGKKTTRELTVCVLGPGLLSSRLWMMGPELCVMLDAWSDALMRNSRRGCAS